jgi:hydroxyacylglutathione hydrolase
MKLTDNLYAYVWKGNDNNCNTFLFANVMEGKKHIIIDPGHAVTPYFHEPAFEILNSDITRDGLKPADIGLVVLTHAHPDHVESAASFKKQSRALIAISQDDEPMYQMFSGSQVDLYLEEGELKLEKPLQSKLEIYKTPGHSPGHISIYWPAEKALAVGDVIFFHNTGRVDLPGGDPALLKESITRLSRLDVEYLLCGHPYENPGVIRGKEAVRKNFEFVLTNIWF